MKFTQQHIDELNLLLQFDLSSAATGIKVHHDASEAVQAAVVRLYTKAYVLNLMVVTSPMKASRLPNTLTAYCVY